MAGYETLVKLELLHSYYKSGKSTDLLYRPLAETQRVLQNQRMLYKDLGGGFGVLYENYGTGEPKITIDEDLELVFGVELKDPAHFLGVTDLDEAAPSAVQFGNSCRMYFYNEGVATKLKYKVLHAIYGQQFSFGFTTGAAVTSIKVTLKNEAGIAVVAEYDTTGAPVAGPYTIASGTTPGEFRKFFDVSKEGEGYYTLEVQNAADNSALGTLQVYINDELRRADVAGVIKINYAMPVLPVTTKNLTIELERAESTWKYYVVNKSGHDLGDIDLVLEDKSGDAGPVYSVYAFSGNPNNGGGGQPNPADGDSVGGMETLVFESSGVIPFYEDPKTGLELRLITDGSDPAIETGSVIDSNLPNPKPAMRVQGSSKVYVYV